LGVLGVGVLGVLGVGLPPYWRALLLLLLLLLLVGLVDEFVLVPLDARHRAVPMLLIIPYRPNIIATPFP